MNDKIKAISLFCGCGGADLGLTGGFKYLDKWYPKNKVEIVHASDIDPKAIKTYNENFKHQGITADVRDLTFTKGQADIVIGGFPCQNFSTVNPSKKPEDRKNQLFWELGRVVDEVRPSVFVGENVAGFYRLKKGLYFNLAKEFFEEIGYTVYHQLVDVSEHGIPQKRKRIFMVGIRNDINIDSFTFPKESHGLNSYHKKEPVKLGAVIDSLVPEDPKYYFSKRAVEGVKRAKKNMKRAVYQDLNKPCLTITSHLAKVSLNSRDPVLLVDEKKELYRRFSPLEAARIQSFPDEFNFVGSQGDAYRQIGNAIPPLYFWKLIREISEQVFRSDSPIVYDTPKDDREDDYSDLPLFRKKT